MYYETVRNILIYWHMYVIFVGGWNYLTTEGGIRSIFGLLGIIFISQSQNYQSITQKQSVIYLNVEGEV